MRALVLNTTDKSTTVQDIPDPEPGPKEILVRVRAVALNHVDLMNAVRPMAAQEKRVLGSDFAGEVAQVGKDLLGLDDPRAKVGAHVSGFLQGANSVNDRPGAFAEYLAIDYDLTWNIPSSVSFEEAASVSLGGVTAAQGVFERLQLPSPFSEAEGFDQQSIHEDEPVNVFIYGASSSVGLYAAQLVRLSENTSGRKIRLTGAASPSKHALLYDAPYSYDLLVDYRDPQWPEAIRKAAGGEGVQYAIDAISQGLTVEQTDSVVRPGGKFAIFRAPVAGNFDIAKLKTKPIFGAVWEALGVEVGYHGLTIPANTRARAFGAAFYQYLGSGVEPRQIKLHPNPIRVMPGGLEKIPSDGFALLSGSFKPEKQDQKDTAGHLRPVSGEKIVYVVA
ncbi:chaperonin 10-like protein [Diaporthe sp. PMI_573]|nr:chaperonin 10-like protein [Diaporthaceae sp. PMI_573]